MIIYPELTECNGKLLIDTGVSFSMISFSVLSRYFKNCIEIKPFEIKTAHAFARHDPLANSPLPSALNTKLPYLKQCNVKLI